MSDPGWINHASGPVSEVHYNKQAIDHGYGLLHWGDIASFDTDDYDDLGWKAESEIEQMSEVVENDQLVVTFYNPLSRITIAEPEDVCVVPATETELLDPVPVEPYGSAEINEEEYANIFKAVRFADETIKEVSPTDAPALFDTDLHPRHWAACDWGQIKNDIVINAHQNEPLPYEPSSLTPTQIEICGEEYLRLIHPSFRRISTLGGQQKDIDVIGFADITERETVVAEMTGGSMGDAQDRRDRLNKHVSNAHRLYLFAPKDSRPENLPDAISFVSLEKMFDKLDNEPRTKQMLQEMLMYHS
jgi:hypothetical protein